MDQLTDYAWLIDDVAAGEIAHHPDQVNWFVDAVRKEQQVQNFRNRFPNVLHVHLTAPEEVLRSRFLRRARDGDDVYNDGAYELCVAHPNEQSARALHKIADLTIDLSENGPGEAAQLIWAYRGRPSCTGSSS